MDNSCKHNRTKVDTRTGEKPRHICLMCGLILNTNLKKTEPKEKDASNPQKEKN